MCYTVGVRYIASAVFLAVTACRPATGQVDFNHTILAETVLESTVKIKIDGGGHGSGAFCFEKNMVCTAAHVVDSIHGLVIEKRDGAECAPLSLVFSPDKDIAIVEVDCEGDPLREIGDPLPGMSIMAAGSPGRSSWNVTFGHVSNAEEEAMGQTFFSFDAPVNPGNSGGPIVDMHGCFLGVVNAIRTRDGLWAGQGFGTAAKALKDLLD